MSLILMEARRRDDVRSLEKGLENVTVDHH